MKNCKVRKCKRSISEHGFCKTHAAHYRRHGDLERLGTRKNVDYEAATLRVKKAPKDLCRLIVNRKGCKEEARVRGLCQNHYNVLRYRGSIEEFGFLTKKPVV